MQSTISFVLDQKIVHLSFPNPQGYQPTTTVLNYLRSQPCHKGVKEGCAEGDCGACTVVLGELHHDKIRYKAVDSCLVFLAMLHGKQLLTVENLATGQTFDSLHPVQKAMVETNGSQCGFCTPGIMMSLFSLYKDHQQPSPEHINDYLTGNLCRCTGYKPIIEAAVQSCIHQGKDQFTQDEGKIQALLQSIPTESIHLNSASSPYFQPKTLSEVFEMKVKQPDSLLLSGATDIALRVTKQHQTLPPVLDLSQVKELQTIQETETSLTLGAGLHLNQVMSLVQKDFPAFYQILEVFGSRQIRNLATLGGNLGTASPIGDTAPILMAYNATILLESLKSGQREVSLDDFFKGYRETARTPEEVIVAVRLPKTNAEKTWVRSYKISKRKDLDISTLSGGFRLERNTQNEVTAIKLVYGGMAAITKRAQKTESFLIGKKWTRPQIEEAMTQIDKDFTPISDVRGSVEMRRIAAKNLLLKFWSETH